jgi:tetratricopeptide (TPR) repeat protein
MVRDSSPVITYVEKAALLAPADFVAQYYYGWMLFEAGEYGRALAPLERANELRTQCPDHAADVLAMLGMCCVNQGLARGSGYLQALRPLRPADTALAYNAIGVLCAKKQDYQGALGWFMQALGQNPNQAVVLQNLAVLFDERLQRPDEAMRYYARAIAARQNMFDSTRQNEMRRRLRQLAADRRQPAGGRR